MKPRILTRLLAAAGSLLAVLGFSTESAAQNQHALDARSQAVINHWTPSRINSAIPRDLVIDERGLGYMRLPGNSLVPYGHDVVARGATTMGESVAPSIGSRTPANNATIGASATFSAVITDASGIKSVNFYVQKGTGRAQQFAGGDGGLRAVGHAEPVEHHRELVLHRARGDSQPPRDLLVRQPFREQLENLPLLLAHGEGRLARLRRRGELPRQVGRQVDAAVHHQRNRALQHLPGVGLGDDAGGAVRERLPERPRVLVHGVDDEGRGRRGGAEALDEGEPVVPRKMQIEEHQVDVGTPAQDREALLGVGGLDHLDGLRGGAEHFAQRGTDQRMIVHREDDRRPGRRAAC